MIKIFTYTSEGKITDIPFKVFSGWDKNEKGKMLWIDMCDPSQEDAKKILKDLFNFHPLVIEDTMKYLGDHAFHYPKIDEFENYLFIVFNEIGLSQNKVTHRVSSFSIFIGHNFLITVHTKRSESIFKRFIDLPNAEDFKRGPDYLLHLILDEVVDKYYPILDKVEKDFDEVEDRLFKKEPSNLMLYRILNLKKNLLKFRRISIYQKDILFKLSRGDFKFIDSEESIFYRNVYDHLVSVTETTDTYRDLITGLLDSYLSIVNNNMNKVIKVLTIFAAIILPLTLFTGIYGMNFDYLPFLHHRYGFWISLGIMLLIVALMLAWFKRMKWF